tara:strand:- start:383 stop:637 length:255 start_codon:yes stop_codon:yes gene_type:complete
MFAYQPIRVSVFFEIWIEVDPATPYGISVDRSQWGVNCWLKMFKTTDMTDIIVSVQYSFVVLRYEASLIEIEIEKFTKIKNRCL